MSFLKTWEYKLQLVLPLSLVLYISVMLLWSDNTSSPQATTPVIMLYKLHVVAKGTNFIAITLDITNCLNIYWWRSMWMTNYIISSFPKALSFKLFWCRVIEHLEFGVHKKSKVHNCVFPCTAVVSSYEFSYNTKKLGKIKIQQIKTWCN